MKFKWRDPNFPNELEIIQSISTAAHRLFCETYENTSTNRIAKTAGVNISSLYRYFENKESILAYLCIQFIRQTRVEVQNLIILDQSQISPNLRQFLISLLDAGLARYQSQQNFLKLMYQEGGRLGLTQEIFDIRKDISSDIGTHLSTFHRITIPSQELQNSFLEKINLFMGYIQGQSLLGNEIQSSPAITTIVDSFIKSLD